MIGWLAGVLLQVVGFAEHLFAFYFLSLFKEHFTMFI